jgi:hypothetical protein
VILQPDAMGTELEADLETRGNGITGTGELPQGSLEGNIIQVGGPQVQVRGTLKCTEKGVKTHR